MPSRIACVKIQTIALVYDLLSADSPLGEVDAAQVLQRLTALLAETLYPDNKNLLVRLRAEPLIVPAKVATSLALIVNELVNNAFKHSELDLLAEEPTHGEALDIELVRHAGRVTLSIEDFGPGFAPAFDPANDAHIGLELVQTLVAADLQGAVTFGNVSRPAHPQRRRGRVEIVFPEQPAVA